MDTFNEIKNKNKVYVNLDASDNMMSSFKQDSRNCYTYWLFIYVLCQFICTSTCVCLCPYFMCFFFFPNYKHICVFYVVYVFILCTSIFTLIIMQLLFSISHCDTVSCKAIFEWI